MKTFLNLEPERNKELFLLDSWELTESYATVERFCEAFQNTRQGSAGLFFLGHAEICGTVSTDLGGGMVASSLVPP